MLSKKKLSTLSMVAQTVKFPDSNIASELSDFSTKRVLLKPDDQLDLTEVELEEEITKTLTRVNTNKLDNLVIYSFKDREFVPYSPEENVVTLFSCEGTAIHKDSDEAKDQIVDFDADEKVPTVKSSGKVVTKPDVGEEEQTKDKDDTNDDSDDDNELNREGRENSIVDDEQGAEDQGNEDGGLDEPQEAEATKTERKPRKLINQFNFCERATLTYNNPLRTVETQTKPPPKSTFGGNVLQWIIYDSYTEDYAQQLKTKENEKKSIVHKKDDQLIKNRQEKSQQKEELNKKYIHAWQILERMINQNIYDEIAHDYRYYEDPADEFRNGEGTLLPLWKFSYEKTKNMHVTDMAFNPKYYDLFAVTFGSFDFLKQNTGGTVCFFTVKNPGYPDFIITTESAVICCDTHVVYPFLIVIGMHDGNVAVYNIKNQNTYQKPVYISKGVNEKHSECVCDVKWGPNMPDGEMNFYSISIDGQVFNWMLMQNKLSITVIRTLYIDGGVVVGPDGAQIKLKNCGTCMTFHPTDSEIFLVGTEEGVIYKCNTTYSAKYMMTYDAHYLTIYRIDYNKYNSNIFVSCSGDWRIKIWEDMRSDPLFIFDLGAPVGDVKWAPYSSTVFAAVTHEGKVFVFDLNVNKYKAICIQQVVSKRRNKLTRLAFNEKLPFIIVGDEKGTITSLKLSPNLRVQVKPPKKQQNIDQYTLQVQKLDKILSLVREPQDNNEFNDNESVSTN